MAGPRARLHGRPSRPVTEPDAAAPPRARPRASGGRRDGADGQGGAALLLEPLRVGRGQLTRPYQTLRVQIFSSRTTDPVFGACQILPFPA